MGCIEREIVTAVMQGDASSRHHQPRPEAHVIALDEGHHIAFIIGGAQIHGAAARRLASHRQRRARAYQLSALVGISIGQQILDRDPHMAAVGDMRQAVGISQLDGFDLAVIGQQRVAFAEIEAFQDIQGQQSDQAMAVRRNFPYIIAAVVTADRRYPLRLVSRQVGTIHITTGRAYKSGNLFGQRATIETGAIVGSDRTQGIGMPLRTPNLASARRPAAYIERIEPGLKMRVLEFLLK